MKYTIYQPKKDLPMELDPAFMPLDYNINRGIHPSTKIYNDVYTGEIAADKSIPAILEDLFEEFNIARPADFRGHSLSVGDVIALDDNCYYVDPCGFKTIPDFFPPSKLLCGTELEYVSDSKWKIPEGAFRGRTDLPEIFILPEYISEIGDHAFDNSSVKHVEIPAGCKYKATALFPDDCSITGHVCLPNPSLYKDQIRKRLEAEVSQNSTIVNER